MASRNAPGRFGQNVTLISATHRSLSEGITELSGIVGKNKTDLWYRRNFIIPSNWKGKHILLHAGAVDRSKAMKNTDLVLLPESQTTDNGRNNSDNGSKNQSISHPMSGKHSKQDCHKSRTDSLSQEPGHPQHTTGSAATFSGSRCNNRTIVGGNKETETYTSCLLYTSPSPRDA